MSIGESLYSSGRASTSFMNVTQGFWVKHQKAGCIGLDIAPLGIVHGPLVSFLRFDESQVSFMFAPKRISTLLWL